MIQTTIHKWHDIIDNDYNTQRGRILRLLREGEFVPTAALRLFSYQYNARIFELREMGHNIESCREEGKYGFRYI